MKKGKNRKPGRPETSGQVRIEPELNPTPDIRKLGRALLALALHLAKPDNVPAEKETVTSKEISHDGL